MLSDARLDAAFDATWPAEITARHGGIIVARAPGAGERVNTARRAGDWTEADIDAAIAQYADWAAPAMFRVENGDEALTQALMARGFTPHLGARIMGIAAARLTDLPIPPVTTFDHWPPMAIQRDIWTAGGFGGPRIAVMERVSTPKTAILGRIDDRAAAAGFLALSGDVAMIHALEVAPEHRRKGMAGWMMRHAAKWAQAQGADLLALAVGTENEAAQATYRSLGFDLLSEYRYFTAPSG